MSTRIALAAPLPAALSQGMAKHFALAAILMAFALVPAFAEAVTVAEAVTYTGTVGGQGVVVELSELEGGSLVGRYSYLSNGADIPLRILSTGPSEIVLAEEVPCTSALCTRADGNNVLEAPLGGQFLLHYSADLTQLTGTWRASASASAELPVELTRFGRRAYNSDSVSAYLSLVWTMYSDTLITRETSPYDYAKMQVALTEGPLQGMGGATYREVIDPRTQFAFPRIVSLPGGGDVAPINAVLDQRRWATNFSGFECLSMDYLSGVWMPLPFGTGGLSLGGVDQTKISVDYLSDTVMTISQASHYSCAGGEPYDYVSHYTYDVRAGRVLDLSAIFKDWDASNGPSRPLIDWFIAAYRKVPNYDAAGEWCFDNDDLGEAFEVNFAQGDVAVFMIGDIEDTACMGPRVSVPLVEIKDLLTDKAGDYFPALTSWDTKIAFAQCDEAIDGELAWPANAGQACPAMHMCGNAALLSPEQNEQLVDQMADLEGCPPL